MRAFQIMVKPVGARCNLDCAYCFYLGNAHAGRRGGMSEELLERAIRQTIEAQDGPLIRFVWQGGEPTLRGLDFYRRAVELQQRYRPAGARVENALQTNGTLLDGDWARFLREHDFLVGVSIDGPGAFNDGLRRTPHGGAPRRTALESISLLAEHGVAFNTLTVVHRDNAAAPLAVYRFLKQIGSTFIQFIPLVVRGERAELSVSAEAWGAFLIAVFDEWRRHDLGRISIQPIDDQLRLHCGQPASLCIFSEQCGQAPILEQNGDLYSCDHFVEPGHRLGRLGREPLAGLVFGERQAAFRRGKRAGLPGACRSCPWLARCFGECPKNRITDADEGEPGLNRLCAGYRRFFEHSAPHFDALLAKAAREARSLRPRRNDPCPCGSGLKFKRCHG